MREDAFAEVCQLYTRLTVRSRYIELVVPIRRLLFEEDRRVRIIAKNNFYRDAISVPRLVESKADREVDLRKALGSVFSAPLRTKVGVTRVTDVMVLRRWRKRNESQEGAEPEPDSHVGSVLGPKDNIGDSVPGCSSTWATWAGRHCGRYTALSENDY